MPVKSLASLIYKEYKHMGTPPECIIRWIRKIWNVYRVCNLFCKGVIKTYFHICFYLQITKQNHKTVGKTHKKLKNEERGTGLDKDGEKTKFQDKWVKLVEIYWPIVLSFDPRK